MTDTFSSTSDDSNIFFNKIYRGSNKYIKNKYYNYNHSLYG